MVLAGTLLNQKCQRGGNRGVGGDHYQRVVEDLRIAVGVGLVLVFHQHRFADVQVEGTVTGHYPAPVDLVGADTAGESPVAALVVVEGDNLPVAAVVLHSHADGGFAVQVAVFHLDEDVVTGGALFHVVGEDDVDEPHVAGVGLHGGASCDGVGESFLRSGVIGLIDIGDGHHVTGSYGDGAVAGSGGLVIVGSYASGVVPGIVGIHDHGNRVGVPGRGGYRQAEGALGQIGVGQAYIKRVAGSETVRIYGVGAVSEPKIAGAGLPRGGGLEGTQVSIGQGGPHGLPQVVLRRSGKCESRCHDLYGERNIGLNRHGELAQGISPVAVNPHHILVAHVYGGNHG